MEVSLWKKVQDVQVRVCQNPVDVMLAFVDRAQGWATFMERASIFSHCVYLSNVKCNLKCIHNVIFMNVDNIFVKKTKSRLKQ